MKCMYKMNVIAKISCYFERSVVTLKFRKEYLNTVTYNTPILLWIKYGTIWYIEQNAILCQHIRELQTFKKQSGFLAQSVFFIIEYGIACFLCTMHVFDFRASSYP